MMKHLLLAATVLGGLAAASRPAQAQAVVACITCPTEVQTAIRWGEEVVHQGKELAAYGKQLAEAQRIYFQAKSAYDAITGVRDLGSAVYAMSVLGISNPLPVNPYALQGLMNGSGGANGMLYSVGSLYNGNQNSLAIYDCTSGTVVCDLQGLYRRASAGTQAASMQLFQSSGQRQEQIALLQTQIAASTDPATTASLTAQLTAANAQSNAQMVQAQAIQTYSQQENVMREARMNEELQRQIENQLTAGRGRLQ